MNTAAVVTFYFQNNEIRTVNIENQPWFVAKDLCDILNIENARQALDRIPEHHKGVSPIYTPGGLQQMNTISEPGLYRLILRSDKPQAEPFMEWITAEVLPTIRKTGEYSFHDDGDFFAPTTDGMAMVTVPRLEEAARGVKAAMIMARAYGWKNEQARQYANNLVKDITGIDTLALLNITTEESTTLSPFGYYREETARIVGEYLAKRCDIEPKGQLSATALYSDFHAWYPQHHKGEIPSQAIFGAIMATYRPKRKVRGFIFYMGITFKEMEVAQ